jgi:hypothetical protein
VQSNHSSTFGRVWKELNRWGVLLESDSVLPSVAGVIVGSGVRGSWWAHPSGRVIFRVTRQLADHPHVLIAKLISGKVTYVHRRLWAPFLAVAILREHWQMEGLSMEARALLSEVGKQGLLRTDQVSASARKKATGVAAAARELEKRLLIHAEEFHTDAGKHAKYLESWEHWTKRARLRGRKIKVEEAKREIEDVLQRLNAAFGGRGKLPWPPVNPAF